MVSGCCCNEISVYGHGFLNNNITYPYSICITFSSFFPAASLYIFVHLNFFFVLVYAILCNIANNVQRIFEIVQKLRSHRHGDMFTEMPLAHCTAH